MLNATEKLQSSIENRLAGLEIELRRHKTQSKRMRRWLLAIPVALLLLCSGLATGAILPSLGALHVFSADTPALASQVNDNFDTVRHYINENGTAITDIDTNKLDNSGNPTLTGSLTVTDSINFNRQDCEDILTSSQEILEMSSIVDWRTTFIQCPDGKFLVGVHRWNAVRLSDGEWTVLDNEQQMIVSVRCCAF